MKCYSQKLLESSMFWKVYEEAVSSMLMDFRHFHYAFENEGCQTTMYFFFFQNIFVKEKEIVNINPYLEYQYEKQASQLYNSSLLSC